MTPRHQFVDRMGGALGDAGVPPMAARVFSALLADPDGRMTAAELGTELEVSAAGVSGAVRYLARVGWVRRERERGSRRDVYVVDDDAWHEALLHSDAVYRPMLLALDAAARELDVDDPAHDRIVLTREFLSFLQREIRALDEKWKAHRSELGL